MIVIINKGANAIVDAEDEAVASFFRWRKRRDGYIVAKDPSGSRHSRMYLHRAVLGGGAPERVDHKNGNPPDCRKSNLRACDQTQNNGNRRPKKGKRFKGVYAVTRSKTPKWTAAIQCGGRPFRYLGTFTSEEQAARAYDRAAKNLFGKFAKTNAAMGLL